MVRGALLIALALVLQSIRVFVPLPNWISAYLIGTLVHMMLVLSLFLNGRSTAFLLSVLLPITAFIQGQILFPVLIPVVMVGNCLFVLLVSKWRSSQRGLFVPPVCKAVCMCILGWYALKFLDLHSVPAVRVMLGAFSIPQLVTGILGIWLARHFLQVFPMRHR